MADDSTEGVAELLVNSAGNVDRIRTTNGDVYIIESTVSVKAAEEALNAASVASTAADTANSAAGGANAVAADAAGQVHSAAQAAAREALGLVQAGSHEECACGEAVSALGAMVADLRGEFFYLGGTVYCPGAKASLSGTTVTLGDACTLSGTTVTLA